jgi:hypothetical protein
MDDQHILVVESHGNEGDAASAFTYSREPHFNGHLQSGATEEHMPNVYEVKRFKMIRTVWATLMSLTVEAMLIAVVLQLRWYCHKDGCAIPASSIAVYINCAVWLFTLVIHRYIRHQRDHLRRHGYAAFYHKTKTTSTVPALVFSTGSVVLLIYLNILHDVGCYEKHNIDACKLGLDTFAWIQILMILEVFLSFPFLFMYLVRSMQFNKRRQTPDIFRESLLDQDTLPVRRDVGFRSQTLVEELLEKQSDAISYLKLRCEHLTRTIFNLMNQISTYNSTDDLRMSLSASDVQPITA